MFLEVSEANYIEDFKINFTFNDGISLIVDLSVKLEGEIFKPLKELSFFKLFSIKHNTIEWRNGADFAPEFLYELGKKQRLIEKLSA